MDGESKDWNQLYQDALLELESLDGRPSDVTSTSSRNSLMLWAAAQFLR